MYIKINLLPPEIRARRERQRNKRIALISAGAVLAIFIVVYGALFLATLQVQTGVSRLQQERTELENKFPALQQYAQLQSQVKQTEELIKEAVGTSPAWASILKDVGMYIPVNVWLTDLSFTSEGDGGKQNTVNNRAAADLAGDVKDLAQAIQGEQGAKQTQMTVPDTGGRLIIRGYAFEYAAVTQWLEQVRQIPDLANVNCQFSSKEELNGEPVIRFEIKAQVLQKKVDVH